MDPFKPRSAGYTRCQLRKYQRVLSGVYVDRDAELTPLLKARAAWVWADGECVLSGISAAAVLGTRWLPERPPEIVHPRVVRATGLIAHRDELREGDVATARGMRVTTPARTAFDLARRQPLDEAVVLVDALYQATRLTPAQLARYASDGRGARGITALRAVLDLADPGAESPQETRLRLLIVRAGLPRPRTQHVIRDERGLFSARTDLAWPEWKVAVEYDGAHHFTDPRQARRDAHRANDCLRAGWRVIRVLPESLRAPEALLEHIREALAAAGYRG
ncbi:DUF559 domain-containing protein [Hoyosella sp. G463]|uniref:DUF559 domain-containing protein n=1 Tax=Lolliginicoccus lacisalsi TaxID=2742202 RepID=A0A927JCE9_9ACTN|nr:DUF559 domain-containing protein [Lolliginicoccus lacisalsi]